MSRPFYKYDAIKVSGIDRILSVVDVYPDYELEEFIVVAEDAITQAELSVPADMCEFVELGQLSLFNYENEDI